MDEQNNQNFESNETKEKTKKTITKKLIAIGAVAVAIVTIAVVLVVSLLASREHVHTWNGERTVLKEPTCQEEGLEAEYCLECGYERTETIPIKKEIHEDFIDRMLDANQESSYEELYALYTEMLAHEN